MPSSPVDWAGAASPAILIALFAASGLVVAVAGIWLVRLADSLGRRTGLGEAMTGGLLLGAATSAGGAVTSITTAASGNTDLAISNAIGGIAAQTAFLVVADLAFRKANLEHAANSVVNLLQCTLLIAVLAVPILASVSAPVTVLGIHPASVVLVVGYLYFNRIIAQAGRVPMWRPAAGVADGDGDDPGRADRLPLWGTAGLFCAATAVTAIAGLVLGRTGVALSQAVGLSETAIGGVLTSTMTSVPELVTSLAAVRRGAVDMAVGGIIGGNAFDTLFLVAGDIAFSAGSLYHRMTDTHVLVLAGSILMTAILLMGLIRREPQGPANIGFEGVAILALYATMVAVMALS